MLHGVYPEPLHCAQGRSQRKGERVQHDNIEFFTASHLHKPIATTCGYSVKVEPSDPTDTPSGGRLTNLDPRGRVLAGSALILAGMIVSEAWGGGGARPPGAPV
jgi:hypothetical protein